MGARQGAYCPEGHGLAVQRAAIRDELRSSAADALWDAAAGGLQSAQACPECSSPLELVVQVLERQTACAHVCRCCELFWFDAGELTRFEAVRRRGQGSRRMPPLEKCVHSRSGWWARTVLLEMLIELTARVLTRGFWG